jgi:hypothetical protein
VPLVLCYLQGHTQEQAAALLGMSKGTLKRRLERGRALLRERLVRRGLGPALVLLASVWPGAGSAGVPPALVRATVHAGTAFAAHAPAAAATVSAHVVALVEGGMRPVFATTLKLVTAVVLALGMASTGWSWSTPAARRHGSYSNP